jgi:phage shock protein PspC (stress-responsive transcriptional regulator)
MNTDTLNTDTLNPEDTTPSQHESGPVPLRRAVHGRMLAGVAAGLGDYLGLDAVVVRVAFALLTIAGGVGVPLYLAGALLIPEEGSDQSIAAALIQSIQSRSR